MNVQADEKERTLIKFLLSLLSRFGIVTTYGKRSIGATSIRLFLKRRILAFLGYRTYRTVSLFRSEDSELEGSTLIGQYSGNHVVELVDPRNSLKIGHYFNSRHSFVLKDVLVDPFHGLVFSEDGRLIKESTNMNASELYKSYPFNPKYKEETEFECCIVLPSTSYWHWLYEDLPLFLRAHAAFPNLPVLVSNRRPKYVNDLIQFLGVKILQTSKFAKVSKFYFYAKSDDYGWPHPSDISTLKEIDSLRSIQGKDGPKRVFVERGKDRRTPVNEREIATSLRQFGFVTINTKEMNFIEEISLFRQVEVLAGIHGAGQGNMVWSNVDGLTLIDLVQENYWTESGFKAASVMGHNYLGIPYSKGEEVEINVERVVNSIQKLIDFPEKLS